MKDFLIGYCREFGFPEEDERILCDLYDRIFADPELKKQFTVTLNTLSGEEDYDSYHHSKMLPPIAEKLGVHFYTVYLLFYIVAGKSLRERYLKLGLPEQIYHDSIADVYYKYRQCKIVYGIPGLFTEGWHSRFFVPDRYKLGRLQFELNTYDRDIEYKGLKRGDPVIGIHIPESGEPFDKETRFDSYKRAYEFYLKLNPAKFPDGRMGFCTDSWLLFPEHRKFLKGCPNVLSFMDDFDILEWRYAEHNGDLWRIFGTMSQDLADFPAKTSMQRSYLDYMRGGGVPGTAFGIFMVEGPEFFDRSQVRNEI